MKLPPVIHFFCGLIFFPGAATVFALDDGYSTEAWTLERTVLYAVEVNPELKILRESMVLASLEEPALLANTDPIFFGSFQKSEDWSPTPVPQIMGRRTIEERLSFGVAQKWLVGTQFQFALQGNRYDSDAPFRALNPTYSDRFMLEVRQPLLKNFWGRPDQALRRKARKNVLMAKAKMDQAIQDTALRVVDAYLELNFTQQDLTIKQEALKDLRALLRRQEEKQSYGISEETDILQTKSALRLKEVEVRIAETLVKIARQNIFTFLSFPEPAAHIHFKPVELSERKVTALEVLLNQARIARFDLLFAQAQIESLESELRSVRLSSLPSLDFLSKYSLNSLASGFSGASGNLTERGKPYYLLGLEIQVPIFGKMERTSVQSIEAKLRQAKEQFVATQNRAGQEVRNNWELYQLAVEKTNALADVIKIQTEKYAEEKKNFLKGRSTTDALIRFQSDVYQSQSQWLRAQLDEVRAGVALNLVAGGLRQIFPLPN